MDLKCDAHTCNYVEDVEKITSDLIGKPCPLCGANLLTKEDYDHWVSRVMPAYELMVALGLAETTERGDPRATRIGYHDGKYTIELPKEPQ